MNHPDPGASQDGSKWEDAISRADDLVRQERSSGPNAPRPLPGQGVVMIVAGLMVAALIAWTYPRFLPGTPTLLSPTEQASDLRAEAAVLIEQIEAYREEFGTLPAPDVLTPFLDEGYHYRVLDPTVGQYEVRRTSNGMEVTYDGTLSLGLWLVVGGTTAEGPG